MSAMRIDRGGQVRQRVGRALSGVVGRLDACLVYEGEERRRRVLLPEGKLTFQVCVTFGLFGEAGTRARRAPDAAVQSPAGGAPQRPFAAAASLATRIRRYADRI